MYDNFRSVRSRNALQIDLNHFSSTHLIVFHLEVCVDVAVAVGICALFSYIICGFNSICLEKRFNSAWKCVLQYWPTSYVQNSQCIYCSSVYIEFYPNELTEQFLCETKALWFHLVWHVCSACIMTAWVNKRIYFLKEECMWKSNIPILFCFFF